MRSKGAGRLDIEINLFSLCRVCHAENHCGHRPTNKELRAIVARRERTTPEAIEDAVHLILRLPKDCRLWQLEAELAGVSAEVKRLVLRSIDARL